MSSDDPSTVIVTGGSSGLGLAITRRILDEGRHVAACDINSETIAALQSEPDYGTRLTGHQLDVSDQAAAEDFVAEVVASGPPISGLVNSAGIGRGIPALDTDVALFRKILDVNLVGSFIMAKAVFGHMSEGGSIVNIASVAGMTGSVDRVAYGSSKAGVINMTQVMAAELGTSGIRINAVAPGPVDTPMTREMHDQETREAWLGRVPMRRYGTPEEIAGAVWFLLTDDASYINGHCLPVDGGFAMAGLMRPAKNN